MDWRRSAVTSSGRRDWRSWRLWEVLDGGRRRRRSREASRDIVDNKSASTGVQGVGKEMVVMVVMCGLEITLRERKGEICRQGHARTLKSEMGFCQRRLSPCDGLNWIIK